MKEIENSFMFLIAKTIFFFSILKLYLLETLAFELKQKFYLKSFGVYLVFYNSVKLTKRSCCKQCHILQYVPKNKETEILRNSKLLICF